MYKPPPNTTYGPNKAYARIQPTVWVFRTNAEIEHTPKYNLRFCPAGPLFSANSFILSKIFGFWLAEKSLTTPEYKLRFLIAGWLLNSTYEGCIWGGLMGDFLGDPYTITVTGKNHPKTRFFVPHSSTRRDQRVPTMGMGRVPTPSRMVGGQPLFPSG